MGLGELDVLGDWVTEGDCEGDDDELAVTEALADGVAVPEGDWLGESVLLGERLIVPA